MDRHDLDAVTAKDVAEAHQEDLKIQHKYDCKALTYWFDEERGTAFCLIEAPNADCVKKMHDKAHGLIPNHIIEVEANVVSAFLGRIEDPHAGAFLSNTNHRIIDESAFRIIMYIWLKDIFILKSAKDQISAVSIINSARDTIQKALNKHKGREVKKDSKRLIVSFTSAVSAIACASEIQNELNNLLISGVNLKVKIGLSAGTPVFGQEEFFGSTVRLARRLSEIANLADVVISSEVREVYNNENLNGLLKESPIQILSPDDEHFIQRLIDTTETIWNDPQFDVGNFGKQVGLSRSQFYRKISSVTGLSPNEFIREYRLEKALNLIETQKGNVAQITYETGFNNPSYFSKCFQKRYGVLPSSLVSKMA
jgi:AraC-like DNA-binding protein